MVYGGEIFGSNAPSPYQIYRDQEAINMQNRRYEQQERKEQERKDARVTSLIRSSFDSNHFTTGTTADPVINEMLSNMVRKYRDMYVKSGKNLDAADMSLSMQRDIMEVNAYKDNVKVIKANVMKEADAIAKQYPGFNAQQIYQKAMDRALTRDGVPIQNIEDFDLSRSYANEVIDEDYGGLNIGQDKMFDNIKKPSETQEMQIVTRDKSGNEFMVKGEAKFNPRFQELSFNPDSGEPTLKLKTTPVTTPDGQQYMDKQTGKPVEVLDDDAYEELIQNRQFKARTYQIADRRIADMEKAGIPVNDDDREILRRQAATEQVGGVFGNKKAFTKSEKSPLPKNSRYKVGKASEMLPFNLDAAPVDESGNKDLTGQVGGFTIKDQDSRYGNTPAEVWLTPSGGLLIRSYRLDERGNRMGRKPDRVYYGQNAKNFVESNNGWSGNNKKDLFKLLDLFDGSGEAPVYEVPKSDLFPDPYKEVKGRTGQGKKSETPAQKQSKKNGRYDDL